MNLTAVFRVKPRGREYYRYAVLTLKRENDVLVWHREKTEGIWRQWFLTFDSIIEVKKEYPEAVLSYRYIKNVSSVPFKESDLRGKPALYNHEWFWVTLGSLLLSSCFMTGLFLIHLIGFYSLLMIAPAVASLGITIIGHDTFVWR